MTMITPSYLGETIEYSSLHACRSTLEDPTVPHLCRAPCGKGGDFDFQPDAKKSGALTSSDQHP